MVMHYLILAVMICVQSTALIGSAHELHALYTTADMEQGRQHPFLRLPYDLRSICYSYLSGIAALSDEERKELLQHPHPSIMYRLTEHELAWINLKNTLEHPSHQWTQSLGDEFILPYFLQAGGHYWATRNQLPWRGSQFLATKQGMVYYRHLARWNNTIRYGLPQRGLHAFARYDAPYVPTERVTLELYESIDDAIRVPSVIFIDASLISCRKNKIAQATYDDNNGQSISLLEYHKDTSIKHLGSIPVPSDHLIQTMHFLAPGFVASYGSDQTVNVWDLNKKRCINRLYYPSPTTAFLRVKKNPDSCVVLGHQDGSITTWQWKTNTILSHITRTTHHPDQDKRAVLSLALIARALISNHADGVVRVWNDFTEPSRAPTCLIEQSLDCPVMLRYPLSPYLIFVDKQDKIKTKKLAFFDSERLEQTLQKKAMPTVPGCPVQ